MSRLIYADAVLYALVEEGHDNATKYGFRLGDTIKFTPTQVDEIVSRMPTIEERKKGKWSFIGDNMFECTCCGTPYTTQQLNGLRNYNTDPYAPNFCPNCGADMREREGAQDG